MKAFNYFLFALSLLGIIYSIVLIIQGNQPCGSDGCLIHILYMIGTVLLFISGIIFYFSRKNILKYRKKEDKL
jgi:hypothetical protein